MISAVPLVGRETEMAVLQGALERSTSGFVQCVVLEGEAGIGKSRLAAEVCALAEMQGLTVMVGEADRSSGADPLGVLLAALLTVGESLDGLAAASDYVVRERLLDRFEKLATAAPIVLVLEDVHWADAATVSALPLLVRRLTGLQLLVVATTRLVPPRPDLDDVLRRISATRLPVGPLATEASYALAASCGSTDVARVVARSGGNPFFLIELTRRSGDDSGEAPADVARAVVARLEHLRPETLAMLRSASALGSTFGGSDLAAVCRRSTVELLPAIHEAMLAGLLEECDQQFAFRHDIVRAAIYESLPAAARRALHRDAGRALAASDAAALKVAEQYSLAAEPGDREAIDWLVKAADGLSARPAPAALLLRRALDLTPRGDPSAAGLARELAMALETSGAAKQAEAVCRDALAGRPDPTDAGPLHVRLLRAMLMQGRGADVLEEAERGASRLTDPSDVALAAANVAMAALFAGDRARGEAAAREVLATQPLDTDEAAYFAHLTLSVALRFSGRVGEALVHAERASQAAVAQPDLARFDPEHFRVMCLFEHGRIEDCDAAIVSGRRGAERWGVEWNLAGYHYLAGRSHMLRGEWDDALTEFEAGLASDADARSPDLPGALAFQAQIYLRRGEFQRASSALRASAEVRAAARSVMGLDRSAAAEAALAEAQGIGGAYDRLAAMWSNLEELGVAGSRPEYATDLVRAVMTAGDASRASHIAAEMTKLAAVGGSVLYDSIARHCRALADSDAVAAAAAADSFGRLGLTMLEARASEDAAALSTKGDAVAAQERYLGALAVYEGAGATRDSARVLAALRAMGVRRGARGARGRPTSGWESLTPTELAVVGLIADGLTTAQAAERLFVSTHTITTHVKHVFAKLGVSSRLALATVARDHRG